MNKQIKKNKKGFTLVEMIVVIAIIGVLAAMMVPSLLGYIKKANTSNNKAAATQVARMVQTSLAENNNTTITYIGGAPKSGGGVTITVTGTDTGNKVKNDLEKLYGNDKFKGGFGVNVTAGTVTKAVYEVAATAAVSASTVTSTTSSSQAAGVYPE
nr:type II secretion system protein [uncultured Niameybacter sp.]